RTATTSWRSTSATPTKSGGRIDAADVHSISLDDIRLGGPQQVAAKLRQVTAGAFVVVNCTDYADLEIVALGLLEVEDEGSRPCSAQARRSSARWRASSPRNRCRPRTSGRTVTPVATAWWSSARTWG
ncbi:MAG: hypothetical protein M3P91_06835, partial [Actinomycetota bacterium]|nr:hypothetical protein [Actinomycetota bacterium]